MELYKVEYMLSRAPSEHRHLQDQKEPLPVTVRADGLQDAITKVSTTSTYLGGMHLYGKKITVVSASLIPGQYLD